MENNPNLSKKMHKKFRFFFHHAAKNVYIILNILQKETVTPQPNKLCTGEMQNFVSVDSWIQERNPSNVACLSVQISVKYILLANQSC